MHVDEARNAVVAALRTEGLISGTQPYRARGAALAPLRAADRAAHLAAVVLRHDRARRARDRGRRRTARCVSTRSARTARSISNWLENIRPWCVSRQLWWGHQIPGLVLRRRDLRGHRPTRGRAAGSAIRTCSTRGSPRRCGRSRRSAGPRRRPSCARSTRPTSSSPARDIIFLWVARMVMMGIEFTGELPFTDVPITLRDPGARRPAHVEVARHRDRPARRDRRARRRRACASACSRCRSTQDVRYSRGARQAGRGPREQALERVAARAAARARTSSPPSRARRPSRTAGSCRGSSALTERVTELIEGFATVAGRARALRRLLERRLRLVPRAGQAAAVDGDAPPSATLLWVLERC